MKRVFTKEEVMSHRGCYEREQIEELYPKETNSMSIEYVLNSSISIKDKRWFVFNNCDLTHEEKKTLALKMAWGVLPVYEEKYTEDLSVRKCLQAIESFNKGLISLEELKSAASAAYAAASASAASASAYAAAASAAASAYAAASASASAAAYADSADSAASAASDRKYSKKLQQILIDFTKL